MNRILLVEDQREFQKIVAQILDDSETVVELAASVEAAKKMLQNNHYELMLLDITLPDQDGISFYAELQTDDIFKDTPVIFLTSSESTTNKIAAFSLGAEDYVTKPFDHQELKARVHAKIRKRKNINIHAEEVKIEPFHFKLASQRVFTIADGLEFSLTPKEFKLLYCLATHPDRIFAREELLLEVWGSVVGGRTIDTTIYSLRKKLGSLAQVIEAVPSVGYRYVGFNKNKRVS